MSFDENVKSPKRIFQGIFARGKKATVVLGKVSFASFEPGNDGSSNLSVAHFGLQSCQSAMTKVLSNGHSHSTVSTTPGPRFLSHSTCVKVSWFKSQHGPWNWQRSKFDLAGLQ